MTKIGCYGWIELLSRFVFGCIVLTCELSPISIFPDYPLRPERKYNFGGIEIWNIRYLGAS